MASKYDMGKLVMDNPSLHKRRSYVPNLSYHSQFDMNAGLLYPMSAPIEVLPSDTFKVKHALKIRMTNPPKVPVMDQLVFDMYWFYVPNRIVWSNYDDFFTGNVGTRWNTISDKTIPVVELNATTCTGSLFDLMGCFVDLGPYPGGSYFVNALPFRGYKSIWNYYFRFESLQDEIYFPLDDSNESADDEHIATYVGAYYTNLSDYLTYVTTGKFVLAPVNKLPGYYERALPMPQASPDVEILGLNNAIFGGNYQPDSSLTDPHGLQFNFDKDVAEYGIMTYEPSSLSKSTLLFAQGETNSYLQSISGSLTGITGNTIRDLRYAFMLQHLYELDATWGRRVNEYTEGHFGTNVPDYRLDQPEFLSHKRVYIGINQVIQSSSSTEASPQGNVGAWSDTIDTGFDFVKSFCENGFLIPVCCIRILNHTYSQGLQKLWTRSDRLDFYDPVFAGLGDMPIYTHELFAHSTTPQNAIFGYQESWAEYKWLPNHVAGHCRPNVANSLAVWNYSEYFTSRPYLDATWVLEGCSTIDRTMYLESSTTVSQFIVDCYFDIGAYRCMPLHNIMNASLTNSW
nr:MAG: major capsid protein [Microvirus sp.]